MCIRDRFYYFIKQRTYKLFDQKITYGFREREILYADIHSLVFTPVSYTHLFQAAVLFLILVNQDGSINLQTGNPALYETIRAALRLSLIHI